PLEQPAPRQQRRGQRPAQEQRREEDAGDVERGQAQPPSPRAPPAPAPPGVLAEALRSAPAGLAGARPGADARPARGGIGALHAPAGASPHGGFGQQYGTSCARTRRPLPHRHSRSDALMLLRTPAHPDRRPAYPGAATAPVLRPGEPDLFEAARIAMNSLS